MKASDDLLSVQGTVRTLVDKEGYLVREDSLNGRYRYPLSGGPGQSYTAGSGLILDNNEFSVDFTSVAAKDDVITYSAGSGLVLDNGEFSVDFTEVAKPYSAGSGLQLNGQEFSVNTNVIAVKDDININKRKIKTDEVTPITGTFELKYNPNYTVFMNVVTLSSNVFDIGKIDFTDYQLDNDEEATFESWVRFTNKEDALTISVDEDITVVNTLPDALDGDYIHVFVRRVFKANNTLYETMNYAYSIKFFN